MASERSGGGGVVAFHPSDRKLLGPALEGKERYLEDFFMVEVVNSSDP